MELKETIETVGEIGDAVGVAAIVIGIGVAAVMTVVGTQPPSAPERYRAFRRRIGRAILLGLELLVAADIIRTVAVEPTFTSVGVLAGIVAIRTFLSLSLELELEGRWPWQRAADRG